MAAFKQLLVSGVGLLGRPLGPTTTGLLGGFLNAVELQFDIDAATRSRFASVKAKQWLGPESHWVRRTSPFEGQWERRLPPPSSAGGGDDPELPNVKDAGAVFAYYDNPGPNIFNTLYAGVRRICVLQTFTGWIEGVPREGGAPVALTEVAPWFSRVDIVNLSTDAGVKNPSNWNFNYLTEAGKNWRDVNVPPTS